MSFFKFLFGKKEKFPASIQVLPTEEFLGAVLDKPVQLIDVRTPREYEREHIKGATNVDWSQPFSFKKNIKKIDREKPVYVYCRTGNRSARAARTMSELGFSKIYDLKGGIVSVK